MDARNVSSAMDQTSVLSKFLVLLSLEIPSILISSLIFTYFIYYRRTRINDYNHSMLVLLAINFLQVLTNLPMPINYFHMNGQVIVRTRIYCTAWIWYEFSLNTINGFLMAWISLERYMLIFYRHFLQTGSVWKYRTLHILPIIICCTWGPIYYLLTVIISPMCQSVWNYEALLCGYPCYLLTNWGTFDLFVNVIAPTCCIFVANLVLCVRVIYQQMGVAGRQRNLWNRQKKMALQLGVISLVYLSVWMPLSIAQLGQIYIDSTFLQAQYETLGFMVYVIPLVLPFIYFFSMPEVIEGIRKVIRRRNLRLILPGNN